MAQKEHDTKAEADLATHAALTTTAHGGPNLRYGTLGSRPAAASVNDGAAYFATDDNGGTLYQVQSAAWVKVAPRGLELGYAQIVASQTGIGASATDITGLSVTVTVGSRPILVKARASIVQNNTLNDGWIVQIVRTDTSAIVALGEGGFTTANSGVPLHVEARLSLAAGSYTFKVQAQSVIGGLTSVTASATSPAFVQVVEL